MKLYATVDNEKPDTRPAKKGANEFLRITLSHGNRKHCQIEFEEGDGQLTIYGVNGKQFSFSPFDLGHK